MKVLTNNQYYSDIADTIRQMKGVATTYKPREMASALRDMYSTEVESVPPLTFPSNGNNLLNYRIDGANGGVGDRTKNLLNNTATSQTISGVTFTVNEDGSVTCNGTATNNIFFPLTGNSSIENIIINGCPAGGSGDSYLVRAIDTNGRVLKTDFGEGTEVFNLINAKIQIRIAEDYICNNLTFYPMIRLATIEDDTYEPYGYKVPVVVSGKNLFDETQVPDKIISIDTSNYQIFKQNGKLTINGMTTSSQADTEISKVNDINSQALEFINNNAGNYIFTSSVPGKIMIRYKQNGSDVVRYVFDEYNSTNKIADRIVFRLQQNYQYDNEQMNIMFKLKQIQSSNYEPYIEPTTTNIYLDEPIEVNESKELSDTNVNIPTINGTNILSIDTTIQPSNVYVQAPKNNSYNI